MEREPDWCIVKFVEENEPNKGRSELIVQRKYQWEAHSKRFGIRNKWEYVAEGIPTNEQAIEWIEKYEKLFKE